MTNDLIRLSKDTIDELFSSHDHQSEIWEKLYEIALLSPDWSRIEKVNGYPCVSEETNEYLFEKFIQFDKMHHPEVLAGGLWMNNGFSSYKAEDVPDWMIDTSQVDIVYKGR